MNCPRCDAPAKTETLREFGGVCEKCLLDFAAENDAPAFPHLEILETIGEGGMGVVYKAVQKQLGRTVALKVLSPALASDPAFVERFTREAQALAQLSHPNIVGIHEFGVHDGVPFLVMEYVDGTSLRALLGAKKLPPERALEVVPQICDALAYAHSRGVIHRDIKPENILIDSRGCLKIADFGLAKLAEPDQTRITRTNMIMGTPNYMAPEQMDNPGTVDHRADLYSLGVIFYEMLTGELPRGRFKAPSERAGVDRRLDPVVLKSLERSPDDRFQSAAAMKERVTRLEPAGPLPANRWAWASLACLLGALVVPGLLLLVSGAMSWFLLLIPASLAALAALVCGILGIVAAPRVGGRRRGIAPAVVTLSLLLAAVLALAVVADQQRPATSGSSDLLSPIVAVLLVGGGTWFFMERRTRIQTAWFLFAAGVGLLLLSLEKEAYKTPLAAGFAACLLGANVFAVMGLVQLRGRSAPAAKAAGWALPVVTVLFLGGLLPAGGDSKPSEPPRRTGSITSSRLGDFVLSDLWPEEVDLPAGLRYGSATQLDEALEEAGVPLRGFRLAKTLKSALLLPGRVILIGLEFDTPLDRREWEAKPWSSGKAALWNESRLVGERAVIDLYSPRTDAGQAAVDALWKRLVGSLPKAGFRLELDRWSPPAYALGSDLAWPAETAVVGGLALGPTSRGRDALRMSGFPMEMLEDLAEVRYCRAGNKNVELVGFVFTPSGVRNWMRHLKGDTARIWKPGSSYTLRVYRADTPALAEAMAGLLNR